MELKVAVIGLGYVGLPLAVESGKKYPTTGFDINTNRISQLASGLDVTKEVSTDELKEPTKLSYSSDISDLQDCNFYIITVPTPVDHHKRPDLTAIKSATSMVAKCLKQGDIVVYESTVYPGCTEEVCVPILENESGFIFNKDFFCGYSPERINPGDKVHRLTTITKVTSGSTEASADIIDGYYSSFVKAGTYRASSIKVAEAAKVIENSQRDINIAFVNELALIFERLNIDTKEVLAAAGTKWNFLNFSPGLVGGHCIGVDPFYLTYKAEESGYHPEVILAGRKINDNMGAYIAQRTIKLMSRRNLINPETKVLLMGITFKENCPDIRNSRAIDVYEELIDFGITTDIYDPNADPSEVKHEYGVALIKTVDFSSYTAIIVAVAHHEFLSYDWGKIKKNVEVIFDVKSLLPKEFVDSRL
jgi:UDP-N-acetyl-D-galactosamine dehydrogenase